MVGSSEGQDVGQLYQAVAVVPGVRNKFVTNYTRWWPGSSSEVESADKGPMETVLLVEIQTKVHN